MHAFFCVISFVVVYFIYPETCNVPLESMNELFGDEGGPDDSDDEGEEDEDYEESIVDTTTVKTATSEKKGGWFGWLKKKTGETDHEYASVHGEER